MSKIVIVFYAINALQAMVILVGNAFIIYVFRYCRSNLKRTGLLLINLAVIDLLVGVATFIEIIPQVVQKEAIKPVHYDDPISVFQVLCSCSSVICLVAVSLECAYAVLKPLRHRAASTQAYILSIVFVWVGGLAMALVFTLEMFQLLPTIYSTAIQDVVLVSAFGVVVAAYMAIHTRLKLTGPSLEAHNRHSAEQNTKLSPTLFIIIALSLSLWLPSIVLYTIDDFCPDCTLPEILLFISRVLHLSNSMINPVVYSYRMPMFKESMRRCVKKCSVNRKRDINENSTQSGSFDTLVKELLE